MSQQGQTEMRGTEVQGGASPARPGDEERILGWPPLNIALAVLVGVSILGSFLPWATVSVFIISQKVNGFDADGKTTLIAALVALGLVVANVYVRALPTWVTLVGTLAAGATNFAVCLHQWLNLNDLRFQLGPFVIITITPHVSVEIGLVLTLLAGAGLVALSLFGLGVQLRRLVLARAS